MSDEQRSVTTADTQTGGIEVIHQPRPREKDRPKYHAASSEPVVLKNVTTRLRRETDELLTEAALRQKLKKVSPATRQGIVEAALQNWLVDHGYTAAKSRET